MLRHTLMAALIATAGAMLAAPHAVRAQEQDSTAALAQSAAKPPKVKHDPNAISSDEIDGVRAQLSNAYQLVQRLRPRWLRDRGADELLPVAAVGQDGRPTTKPAPPARARVFVDGSEFGDLNSMKDIDIHQVGELRYIDARAATTRYGAGYPGGIIWITTRH
ncbi:MAG TPA: hypothetical protein VFK13_11930 [Gemmatimonadaceae bacterium]|nr:hypothetical protein [Gemmatimonadaceae bacterium]